MWPDVPYVLDAVLLQPTDIVKPKVINIIETSYYIVKTLIFPI